MQLTCVVENCAARGSALWAEHGLSYWLTSQGRHVLLDTGQSGQVLQHNVALGLWDADLDGLALSHAMPTTPVAWRWCNRTGAGAVHAHVAISRALLGSRWRGRSACR